MLGPANREKSTLKAIRDTAKPRPVAMYRAPPNVRLFTIEWDEIRVEKTSKTNESDENCFSKRMAALPVPRSVSSDDHKYVFANTTKNSHPAGKAAKMRS